MDWIIIQSNKPFDHLPLCCGEKEKKETFFQKQKQILQQHTVSQLRVKEKLKLPEFSLQTKQTQKKNKILNFE